MAAMAYGDGSLFQRKSGPKAGQWEYRRSVNGVQRTATFEKKPSRAQIQAKIVEWSQPSRGQPAGETVATFLDRWLRDGTTDLRGRTVRGYAVLVRGSIRPSLGHVPLVALTTPQIQRWVNDGATYHALAVLRTALSEAVRWGDLDRNPAQLVKAPHPERKEPRVLTPAESRALLLQVKDDPLEALWLLAFHTGMRQGEVLGLRWQDVSLPASTLTVTTSLWWKPSPDGRTPVLTEPKTKRSRRTIALAPAVVEALRAHQKREMFASKDGLVFHRQGIALEPSTVYRALHRHLKAASLPEVTFHSIRHAAATNLIAAGHPIAMVSDLLGHSTVTTTLTVYRHAIANAGAHTAERMAELLGPVSETG